MWVSKLTIPILGVSLLLVGESEHGLRRTRSLEAAERFLTAGNVFRDQMKNGNNGPEMVVVPAGRFRMGDIQGKGLKVEQPVHKVYIRKPFAMGRYEVTFDEYDAFAKAAARDFPDDEGFGRGRRPVIRVSWNEAVDYAQWLSQQTGKRYRLPTEAEWEYAARAGTETAYWWGEEMQSGLANCKSCGSPEDKAQTMPVGSYKPNPFGLHDTAGNVREWVQDCWHENYQGAPSDGSAWEQENDANCSGRVNRGGSLRGSSKLNIRSSSRDKYRAAARPYWVGFRLVREIEEEPKK